MSFFSPVRFILLLLYLTSGTGFVFAVTEQPHIVLIMTDNLGYGDLGVYGGLRAPTPRIDQLAREGIRFRDFQVEPACTASRAALMTGRMPVRSGVRSVDLPGEPGGLHPKEITLAELLKEAGYKTALFGKWHIGEPIDRQPQNQGFDEFMGMINVMAPPDPAFPGYDKNFAEIQSIVTARKGETPRKVAEITLDYRARFDRDITDRAVEYIGTKANSAQPFFLWVSFTNPHHPVIPSPDFAGKSGGGAYADVLMEIDFNTGRVLDAIDEAGIRDDTIIVWISDNGPTMYSEPDQNGDPGPWTGQLGTAWEGGLRTAAMIRWPGRIQSDWVSDEMFHILDLNVTLAKLAGAAIPNDRPIDGMDQSDYLLGKKSNSTREHSLIINDGELTALRWRQFKFHFINHDKELGYMRPAEQNQVPEIFNLKMDPKEKYNLAGVQGGGFTFMSNVINSIIGPYMASLRQHPNADYSKF